ncbi:MAG: hypothetical protein ACE5HX_17740 [bacterium]
MEVNPGQFVAIIGGAVAGSEAASRLSDRGIYSVVFEQNTRPYGKIEDGLPKWHVKLRLQETKKIDEKLSKSNIFFVPKTKLGRDIQLHDLVNNWGFSAILLANGAWKDRELPIEGINDFIGKGLIYQNPLVRWFNHYHESNYTGEYYNIHDNAIVIGGGLASLDVVKILMLETVLLELRKRGIEIDLLQLEKKTISAVLKEHNLSLSNLGLKGCTLFYRRRKQDMPLAQIPPDATPERKEKTFQSRIKIFENFQSKYLFNFCELKYPTGLIVENGLLVGLKFAETEIVNGRPVIIKDNAFEVRSPLVILSIGSIPEPIPGIDMRGELYEIADSESGRMHQYHNVFALGNVVTGRGNIKASLTHGRQVSDHVMDYFLAWRAEDYQELLDRGAKDAQLKINKIAEILSTKNVLGVEKIRSIIRKINACQKRVNYNGDYQEWIKIHSVKNG